MEIWKKITGFKPIYEVSNYGRIRSVSRETKCNTGKFLRKERFLKFSADKHGYMRAYLYNEQGVKKSILVHRLVAEYFIDNPYGYNEVDHIDGMKNNNYDKNLRWVTHQQNCRNPNTSFKFQHFDEFAHHKKAIKAYSLQGVKIGEWPTITKAARETKTCRHSISYAASGKYKTANNLIWKYD